MQLDVDVSLPANIVSFRLILTHVTLTSPYCPVNFCPVTDRRTDRRKVMHKSPPCTGGLKNV